MCQVKKGSKAGEGIFSEIKVGGGQFFIATFRSDKGGSYPDFLLYVLYFCTNGIQ